MRQHFLAASLQAFFLCAVAVAVPAPDLPDVLARLREAAIRKSPEVMLARETLRQKRAQTMTSLAHWLPSVNLQLSQNVRHDLSLLSNGTLPTQFTGFMPPVAHYGEWAFSATLPVYRRAVHLGVEQSSRERDLAEGQLAQVLGELDWRMRELIGNYLLECYRVESLKTSFEQARANLKDTELRFRLGERTRIDLLRAQANLASLESRRLASEQSRQVLRHRLLEFSGLTSDAPEFQGLQSKIGSEAGIAAVIESFSAAEPVLERLAPYLGDRAKPMTEMDPETRGRVEARLGSSSPTYRAALSEAQLAETRARTLMSGEWPSLDLQGQLYKLAPDWGRLLSGGNQSYYFGVLLTIPLFSGGSLFSTSREMGAAERAAEIKREKDLLHLKHEVESEWLELRALERQLES